MTSFNKIYPFKYGAAHNIILNEHDMYLTQAIRDHGEYSEDEVDVMRDLIHGGTVLNIGANFGAHTLALSGLAQMVYAFEPQEYIFQALCGNMALNSVTNVKCIHAAVGAQVGTLRYPLLDPRQPTNFGGMPALGHAEGEECPLITVDSLGLDECAFMLIDVEGAEADVLRGARSTIERYKPLLYLEYAFKRQEILNELDALGYRYMRQICNNNREPNWFGTKLENYSGSDVLLAYAEPPTDKSFLERHRFIKPTLEDCWGTGVTLYKELEWL